MDRLLRYFLSQFIRRGAMTVYDRKRGQIQLRRWHRRAGIGPVPDPRRRAPDAAQSRTGARRSLHGRHVRHRERLDRGCAGDPDGSARNSAALGQAAMGAALSGQACQAVQSAPPRPEQRRASLRSRRPALFALSRCRQAIQLRLFRDARDDAGRRPARQETASRRQAADRARRPRARHRFRLGRPWPVSGRDDRGRRHRRHAVDRTIAGRRTPAPPRRTWRHRRSSFSRTIATFPARSTASSRSACSSMSASTSTRPISGAAPNSSTDDGVMVLHSIGRSEGPDVTNPWITKYIFPGGYIPALSEVMPAIERAGLLVCDIEILRLHYAETLKAWRERFMARREEAVRLYDERFARMWEFYLASFGNVVPQAEPDELPDPAHQAPGRGADDAGLYHARRGQTARRRAPASGRGCRSRANRSGCLASFAG